MTEKASYPPEVVEAIRVIRDHGYYVSLKEVKNKVPVLSCICGRRYPNNGYPRFTLECSRCGIRVSAQTRDDAVNRWNSYQENLRRSGQSILFYRFVDLKDLIDRTVSSEDTSGMDSPDILDVYSHRLIDMIRGRFHGDEKRGYGLRSDFRVRKSAISCVDDLRRENRGAFQSKDVMIRYSESDLDRVSLVASKIIDGMSWLESVSWPERSR